MLNINFTTTVHGSTLIGVSAVFCCKQCGSPVAHVVLPGRDAAYECTNARRGNTVMLDCVEALAIRDELSKPLATSVVLVPSLA